MMLRILQDLRPVLGPVRDQGRRPTCLSFAASAAHEQARRDLEPLCVEWLFYHAAQLAGTGPQEGTTLPDTRHVLRDVGQPLEPVWPYNGQQVQGSTWNPPTAVSPLFRCGSEDCQCHIAQILDLLNLGRPVVLALFVSSAFTAATTWLRVGSEIILPEDGEPIDRQRGHAVVAVGHGHFGGQELILVRNSWGSRWGANGHAWVQGRYLGRRLIDGFSIQ